MDSGLGLLTGYMLRGDTFSSRTGVDTNHGSSDWPRRISDRHFQEVLVRFDIVAVNELEKDFDQRVQDVVWQALYEEGNMCHLCTD